MTPRPSPRKEGEMADSLKDYRCVCCGQTIVKNENGENIEMLDGAIATVVAEKKLLEDRIITAIRDFECRHGVSICDIDLTCINQINNEGRISRAKLVELDIRI